MFTVTDNFPPPSLDSGKWSEELQGTVSLSVGVPSDGLYPENVDALNDLAAVYSENKIYVPANHDFSSDVFYFDLYSAALPPVARDVFFGWRSILKGGGVPLWGVDVIINISAGPTYAFRKREIVNGVETVTPLIPDPTSGADGRFRLTRTGDNYRIYYYNAMWVLLDTINLGFTGVGFVRMGASSEVLSAAAEGFPWILEP